MTKLKLNKTTVTLTSYREPEEFGYWEESYHTVYHDVAIVTGKGYFDTTVDYEVLAGDTLYLVYVVYGSGDSFGHSSGITEVIHIYKSQKLANEALEILEKDIVDFPDFSDNKKNGDKVKLPLDSGGTFDYWTGTYKGYFERVEEFKVVPLVVTGFAKGYN